MLLLFVVTSLVVKQNSDDDDDRAEPTEECDLIAIDKNGQPDCRGTFYCVTYTVHTVSAPALLLNNYTNTVCMYVIIIIIIIIIQLNSTRVYKNRKAKRDTTNGEQTDK